MEGTHYYIAAYLCSLGYTSADVKKAGVNVPARYISGSFGSQ